MSHLTATLAVTAGQGDHKELVIKTCDMHTAGEPVRIVESGYPELVGNSMLEKRRYAQQHFDQIRQMLMNEPRGHYNMYGAILTKPCSPDADLGVLFIHNDGYSTMCGHATIALGRYAVDKGYVTASSPETKVVIDCPCGKVTAYVEYKDGCAQHVRFHSVPSFVYKTDVEVLTKRFGTVKIDIAYGGAFYAFVSAHDINMDLRMTPLTVLVEAASEITDAVKEQVMLHHPDSQDLAFLYGTILTDGKDAAVDEPTENICVFAKKQVDRSPTGSGVSARMALQFKKKYIGREQQREFRSLTRMAFTGKVVEETKCGEYDAVIVEVSGKAYYTGQHTFSVESSDPLKTGFQIPC